MGKYMKKPKLTTDVEVSLSPPCSLGVRTRAKTLALRRQEEASQQSQTPPAESPFSYLELRSRRLEKPSLLGGAHRNPNRTGEPCAANPSPQISMDPEASCGENNLECESRERSTRESTPCPIRELDTLIPPGSTTKRRNYDLVNQRVGTTYERSKIPTACEMEEFFAIAEQHQQRVFIEKYNFDIVGDSPLPGRYHWVEVMP